MDQNLILRWFCRLYWAPVPDDTTLITHSGLLVDSVRVLSRFVQRAKGLVKDQVSNVQQLCRSRLLTARRTAQTLHRQLGRKGEDKEAEQKQLYKKLVHTAEQMVKQVKQVIQHPSRNQSKRSQGLREQAEQVLPLIEFGRQVILDEVEGAS